MKTNILYIVTLLLLIGISKPLHAQKKMLALKDALEMAKQGNKAIQVQILEEIHAREITNEVKGGLLPSISANAAYSRYFDRQVIFLPGSFAGTDKAVQDVAVGGKNVYNVFATLNQPILAPGTHHLTKASKINESIQNEKTADLKSQIALLVSTRYLDMLMMNSQLDLLEQSLQRNKKALQDSRSLLAQGRGLKSDTLRSFVAVANLESSVSYLKNNVTVAGIELKRLIGLEDPAEIELSDNLELNIETSQHEFHQVDAALAIAEKNRKDLNIQELTIALQQKNMKVIQAELLPQLSLIGQYQLQAQADNFKFGQYALPRTSFLGLQLTVPVFNGNRTKSKINQSKIKMRQEEIQLNDLKDEVKTELATLISQWKEAVNQLNIQEKTVQSATLNHQMVDDRFKNSLGSRLELTDAELALTQAKINNLNAIYKIQVLHVKLKHAVGQLSL
ncbi:MULTISPECIES: TolC family protein [unclassified Sphingobacterium]|uniref:TolC family protein n=1 Tax=unclassified Sphingobacterium TaxID=2609468 RepID=UPI001051DDDC|nr:MULTISPECIES: TolC family protein [unclassified Sphingobacterium]MCS3554079.1 outer membrane protein TolC [Sphingobacterium sp. JUb21]TCR07913.1 outer membrane protein TolC [Sphingobacterium sp. JUb20]